MSDCPCDVPTELRLEIAAGLDALPRQLRAFPEVRRALLAALPTKLALRDWRARNNQDLGLMLLEMWAYVSDVLGFYDERIANESYIRTAQRRPSVRRLVELLGFIPSPGVAGSMSLAAIAEGRGSVTLPAGTGFRSDAFGSEGPQVFEINETVVIHPFKNEWTIGPVPADHLPQPTPSELAKGPPDPASGRRYFIFETGTRFGLAAGQIVIVSSNSTATGAARVVSILPFTGKDGKTYNEVLLDDAVPIDEQGLPFTVRLQRPTAIARPALQLGKDTPPIIGADLDDGTFSLQVNLESINTQIAPGDVLAVRQTIAASPPREVLAPATVIETTVVNVTASPNVITIPPPDSHSQTTTAPLLKVVTQLVMLTRTDFRPRDDDGNILSSAIDPTRLTLHHALVDGGVVTGVAKTDLIESDIESTDGLAVTGIVQLPIDATADSIVPGNFNLFEKFLLSDPDKHGAIVDGRMQFDSTGRARLFGNTGTLNPSDQTFKTPLTVMGNLLKATRGETVNNEVLGNGDPRIGGQTFKLKKKPLTYILSNSIDRLSTLQIVVDNVRWNEVTNFLNCGPQSRVYTVRHDDNQETLITFGDGVHGSRLPSGVGNVIATYRFGAGKSVPPPGAITQIARPVIGLRSVRSPVAAIEGRDPDTADDLREAGPRSALLFDRAVSVRDFESVAAQVAGVIRASASFEWIDTAGTAGVVVRFIGTADPDELAATLRSRAELNTIVDVHSVFGESSGLQLIVELDPAFKADVVITAIKDALLDPKTGPLAPVNSSISGTFPASPIYALVQSIPGVVAIDSMVLVVGADFHIDFKSNALFCIPRNEWLKFDPKTGVEVIPADPSGVVTASLPEVC